MSYEGHVAGEIMQKQEPGKSNLKFSPLVGIEIADLMSNFLRRKVWIERSSPF